MHIGEYLSWHIKAYNKSNLVVLFSNLKLNRSELL